MNVIGTYTVTYTVTDSYGNAAIPVIRTVNVLPTTITSDIRLKQINPSDACLVDTDNPTVQYDLHLAINNNVTVTITSDLELQNVNHYFIMNGDGAVLQGNSDSNFGQSITINVPNYPGFVHNSQIADTVIKRFGASFGSKWNSR